jgi:ABC-type nitrate/sulfonate/bicarbonate transport system substrate-binding protein
MLIMQTNASRFRSRRFACRLAFCVLVLFQILAGQPFAQDSKKIRIGYSALSLSFLPQLFARDAGVFQKHGLTVELIQMAGPIQVAALAAGEIDFGAAVSPALFAAVRGLPLRGVMITVKTPLFYIVSEPSLKRIGDLVGKKVAVDTIGPPQPLLGRCSKRRASIQTRFPTFRQARYRTVWRLSSREPSMARCCPSPTT